MNYLTRMKEDAERYWREQGDTNPIGLRARQKANADEYERLHYRVNTSHSATPLEQIDYLQAQHLLNNLGSASALIREMQFSFDVLEDPAAMRRGDYLKPENRNPVILKAIEKLVRNEESRPGKTWSRALRNIFNPQGASQYTPVAETMADEVQTMFFDTLAAQRLLQPVDPQTLSVEERAFDRKRRFTQAFESIVPLLPPAYVSHVLNPQTEIMANNEGYEVRPMTHALETKELLGRIMDKAKRQGK